MTNAEFKKRVTDKGFNPAQTAMLQLRFDLLDSFLRGKEPDISSFFKAGQLLIIDLSDPFVNGSYSLSICGYNMVLISIVATTAAMLFDICLGMFIEWKVSVGKLIGMLVSSSSYPLVSSEIVLDEAHKYLTNSDANQFTKKICSIIRQQRHLSARVVVSTQEPTVVPASVLGLLSWIICHRFSSPAWVRHLHGHICVKKDKREDSEKKKGMFHYYYDEEADQFEVNVPWEEQVMMLRTGEALLFSPASLFVSKLGKLATLSTGYALIMTRARLTKDGGASIFATGDVAESQPFDMGIMTPSSEESDSDDPETQGSADMELAKTQFPLRPQAEAPLPAKSKPASDSGDEPPSPPDVEEYELLIDIMNRMVNDGDSPWIKSSSLANAVYRANPENYPSSFRGYIRKVALTRVVRVRGEGVEFQVALHPALRASSDNHPQPLQRFDRLSLSPEKPAVFSVYDPRFKIVSSDTPSKDRHLTYPAKFQSLVTTIRKLEESPGEWVKVSQIGSTPGAGGYQANGYANMVAYLDAAQNAGIVAIRGRAQQKHVSLIL
jgi:hypothetical protein